MRKLLIGLLLLTVAKSAFATPPNILFLFTDDQAPWGVGVSGYPHAQTPHLDQLFGDGAYIVNSFTVTPVCSPSRASLMTSRYGSEVGITDWINPRVEPDHGLDPDLPTWPRLLQEAGYQTALIGKWHLGLLPTQHPTNFGYGYFMGLLEGGTSPKNPQLEVNGRMQTVHGFTTDILTDEAIRWLRLHDPKTAPFAISVHFRAPHRAWLPIRDEDWEPFETLDPTIPNPDYPKLDVKKVKQMTQEYLASIANVDRNVGRLLEEIDILGLTDNTVVIYSSDHGYNMGHNGIWHKGNGHWILTEQPAGTDNVPSGERPNMYDNSIRVPTAVRWPGVVPPGTVIEETATNLDWFPTIVEMAGTEVPPDVTLRGRSIVPLLRGTANDWDNDMYAQYSTHHRSRTQMRMYRTPQYKLIRDFLNPGRDEFYDLQADPAEATNLIASTDEGIRTAIDELHGELLKKMVEIDDPVLKTISAPTK